MPKSFREFSQNLFSSLHYRRCRVIADFNIAGGSTSASQVLANWESIIGNATGLDTGFIVLEHDLFQQAVEIATGYILPAALANQPPLKIEPVVSCLHKPLGDAYLETNDNKTNPPVVSGTCSTWDPFVMIDVLIELSILLFRHLLFALVLAFDREQPCYPLFGSTRIIRGDWRP